MTEHPILLDRNENQFGPAPACFEVLRGTGLRDLSSYSRDYERKVKSKLSERLAKELGLPEDRILLSYGSEDMLKQAVHCYLRAGEKILIPDLSWWYYKSVAAEVEGVTLEYPLKEGPESFSYDVEGILALMKTEKPRILLLASPNNPTGHSLAYEDLHTLLEKAGDTIVILDEAYRGFSREPSDRLPSLIERHENLLILRTFSKFYALAGVRIGYACAAGNLHRLAKFSTRYLGYNLLSEKLALAALDSDAYYAEMRLKMLEERERYMQELRALPGWKPYHSDANFLLVRIPEETKPALREWLEKKGIAVKFFNEKPLRDCIRITIGREDQNRALLDALREFAELPQNAQAAVPR